MSNARTGGPDSTTLPNVTPEEETKIRNQNNRFALTTRQQAKKRLHIPGREQIALCHSLQEDHARTVKKEVYPRGYTEVCKGCAAIWRDE